MPPDGAALEHFPPPTDDGSARDVALQRRAALASTLMASPESARQESAILEQDVTFGCLLVAPAGVQLPCLLKYGP